MSNSESSAGFLIVLLYLGSFAASIYSGIWAWDAVGVDSFGSFIIFGFVWSVASYVAHIVLGGIVAGLGALLGVDL